MATAAGDVPPPERAGEQPEAAHVPERKAAGRVEGTGYRAVITEDERVIWACAHVHFTEHSAKAHAEAQMRSMGEGTTG